MRQVRITQPHGHHAGRTAARADPGEGPEPADGRDAGTDPAGEHGAGTDPAERPDHGADPADTDPDDDPAGTDPDDDTAPGRDWAWVEEWRRSGERPAWAPGLALAAFIAIIVGLAVLVLSNGLADLPWLAVSANVLVAAGLAPALWLSRHLPVLRWISLGAAAGVLVGWVGALLN